MAVMTLLALIIVRAVGEEVLGLFTPLFHSGCSLLYYFIHPST